MTAEEFYKELGADYQTALSRMMGNQGFLTRMLKKFKEDKNYAALEKAAQENDCAAIFAAAHTIKGVAGNLGLTPLYEACARLSDATRGGRCDGDIRELLKAVRESYQAVTEKLARLE